MCISVYVAATAARVDVFVCVFVCTGVHIVVYYCGHVYICVCCSNLSTCGRVCVYSCVYVCVFLYILVCTCILVCVASTSTRADVCVCIRVFVCLYFGVLLCACVYLGVYLFLIAATSARAVDSIDVGTKERPSLSNGHAALVPLPQSACVYVCVCVCVCVCLCVCVRACLCKDKAFASGWSRCVSTTN